MGEVNQNPNGSQEPVSPLLLEGRGISKAFGHVQALRGVNIDLREGEVLALVGDNGAGKSTLIKIISGAIRPDAGELFMDGEVVHFQNPIMARDHGIETVHQDLAIVPTLTVAENLFLGREIRFKGQSASSYRSSTGGRCDAKRVSICGNSISISHLSASVRTHFQVGNVRRCLWPGHPPSAAALSSWMSRPQH